MKGGSRAGFVVALAVVVMAAVVVARIAAGGDDSTPARSSPTTQAGHDHGDGHEHAGQASAGQTGHPAQEGVPPETDRSKTPVRSKAVTRLEPRILDGVKVFTLDASPVQWELIPGKTVTAWGYNGQVPGPQIWVDEGDKVRVEFTNRLPVATTIHWHGVGVPNEMDGVPGTTQDPVEPGKSFTYEFSAKPSGTFWYHSHFDSARQVDMGLAGAFVIKGKNEPKYDREYVQLIDEWIRLPDGRNGWEGAGHAGHNPGEYNWFTLNGKSFPATEEMVVKQGDRVRVRLINAGYQSHPMHLHGKRTLVVAKDGAPIPTPYEVDTVLVGSGERYDYEFLADDPGSWMFHCHILHHVGNDTAEPGGLMTHLVYEGYRNAYQRQKDQTDGSKG